MSIQDIPSKKCSKCGKLKIAFDFAMHKGMKDGLQSQCRRCQNQGQAQRRRKATGFNFPRRKPQG